MEEVTGSIKAESEWDINSIEIGQSEVLIAMKRQHEMSQEKYIAID